MAAQTQITSVVHSLLDGLHSMSKSETIIGDAYVVGEATIVPVHRLRVAVGAGTLSGGAKQDGSSGESGGVGCGGAVQIEPVAVIAIGRDNVPRIMFVEHQEDALQHLVRQLPDVLTKAAKLLSGRVGPMVEKFAGNNAATIAAATEVIAETVTPMLTSKKGSP